MSIIIINGSGPVLFTGGYIDNFMFPTPRIHQKGALQHRLAGGQNASEFPECCQLGKMHIIMTKSFHETHQPHNSDSNQDHA
jgi:hypothetical protein